MHKFLPIFLVLFVSGCGSVSNMNMARETIGDYVVSPDDDITPNELLAAETKHAEIAPYYRLPSQLETQKRFGQQVNAIGYRAFALRFADQFPSRQRDGSRMLNTALDAANVGMHIAGSSTLGPVWLVLLDYDELGVTVNKEKRYLEMPGVAVFMPADLLPGQPTSITDATSSAGELFAQSPVCQYHSYPKVGSFGIYIKDIIHTRNLMCGEPAAHSMSAPVFGNADITTVKTDKDSSLSLLFGENRIVSTFFWLPEYSNWPGEIDANLYNGTYRTPDYTQGIEGYKALKPYIPEGAYAVFTGPDDTGDWKVFVAHGGRVAAFDPPWTKKFKQADNGSLVHDSF